MNGLTLDAVTHVYSMPDGRIVPGVTDILREVRVSTDFTQIAGLSDRLSRAITISRDLGHAVHADAHAFDDDDLDWTTVDPMVEPYVRAWAQFRDDTRLR